ncbi:MAG TPA: metallophosphoesterase [Vicinamibacterales bacterium]|jgi:3',5'-cyclic AMP phosphodiesterase CpdA|nr:metallophosphoesterase [Vicinamibacterales bacterium]
MRRFFLVACCVVWLAPSPFEAQELTVPNTPGSLKFAAIGDNGTGEQAEYEVAHQMDLWHQRFQFEMVIMLGDNMYGSQRAADFVLKFERPYGPLLDAGVKFYASLGNHDNQSNDAYPLFNMGGERYYTYARHNARFFVLDSDLLDAKQLAWIETALRQSIDDWKICYFHHPLYSDGRTHGSQVDLRVVLEPLFVKYGVNVVFSGHDHVYERIKPQKGITYFVSGAGGQLRKGDVKPSEMTAAQFDQDRSFMLVEVSGDDLFFQAVSRLGATVDSGVIHRQPQS